MIRILEDADYLVVPEGAVVPEGLDAEIVVLQQPLNKIYLAATSAMSLFDAVGALDHIRLTGTQKSGWYIDAAVTAMEKGISSLRENTANRTMSGLLTKSVIWPLNPQ